MALESLTTESFAISVMSGRHVQLLDARESATVADPAALLCKHFVMLKKVSREWIDLCRRFSYFFFSGCLNVEAEPAFLLAASEDDQ